MNLGLNHSILNLLDYFDLFENFEDCSIASCSSYREKNKSLWLGVIFSHLPLYYKVLNYIKHFLSFSSIGEQTAAENRPGT